MPTQKLTLLERIVSIAMACSFVLSWKLWLSSRLFPLVPVSTYLPDILSPLDVIWACTLIGLLVTIAIFPRQRMLVFGFLGFAGLLALWDQARWQPWFYQYFLMLAAIGHYDRQKGKVQRQKIALNICRLIIVFTYVWSGLQKLNANFIREAWPDLAGPFLRMISGPARRVPASLILLVPLVEVFIGLGLLGRRSRNLAVLLALATHGFILILLLSSGENTAVWPWNVAMSLFVLILFWQDKETSATSILKPTAALQTMVLILVAIMPAFSFIGIWDSYLSSALYSGATYQGVVLVSSAVIERLPASVHPYVWQESKPFFLDINRWAYGELNVPVYPEPRIFRKVAEQVCEYSDSSPDIKLLILDKPNLLTGQRKREYFDCRHLWP